MVPADAAPLVFEESPFTFSVMESDPVAHMVGVVATESSDVPVWFEITGTAYSPSHASQCVRTCTVEMLCRRKLLFR